MDDHQVILQATQVSLAYGQHVVVEDLNLIVRSGEFWCCLGPNGAGKSTFMQAILGNISPKQGELWRHPGLQRHTHVGFVPQRCEMAPALPTTVREFVMLGAVGLRLTRQEWRHRLEWALDSVGLHHMARQSYWTLSGGQRQRALVARALLRRPRLMLLDEPTNNLDLPTAEALLQLLVSLKQREHLTLFWVAHDVAMAARYATHVLLLFNRHALAGTAHEVLTASHLSRAYGVPLDISRDTSGALAVRVNTPEHTP